MVTSCRMRISQLWILYSYKMRLTVYPGSSPSWDGVGWGGVGCGVFALWCMDGGDEGVNNTL